MLTHPVLARSQGIDTVITPTSHLENGGARRLGLLSTVTQLVSNTAGICTQAAGSQALHRAAQQTGILHSTFSIHPVSRKKSF